jgi:hypothetical protein
VILENHSDYTWGMNLRVKVEKDQRVREVCSGCCKKRPYNTELEGLVSLVSNFLPEPEQWED